MTATLDREAPAGPPRPRRLETDVEALDIPAELHADSLVALVHNSVLRNPDKEALRWKLPKTKRMAEGPAEEEPAAWTSTSYRQTWDWITQVAMGLKHLGIRDGDRVCIMSRTRPAWLAADLGSLSLGAVTCPIYPSVEPKQAAYVINNVGARLIFVENLQQAAKIEQVRAECPTLELVVVIDDRGRLPEGAISFDDIFDLSTADAGEVREWTETWSGYGRDKVATIVHTSGTTANPKGVVLTHGNILHNFYGGVQAVDFNENDLFLSFLPLSHMTERAAGQIVPLGRGCTIAYAEPAIERLAANMAEVKPTVMVAVPRLYERLYARVISTVEAGPPLRQRIFAWALGLGRAKYANHVAGRPDSAWLRLQLAVADRLVFHKIKARTGGRVRYFVSGGAPLSQEIGEFFYAMGMLILEGYGLTETAPLLTINRPSDFKFGTVGKPVCETQIRIDPDGRVLITDRLKNIIVLGNGKNVAPAPMEIAILTSRYIAQAVILGDNEPYTGVLVVPDFEQVATWAAANGIAGMPHEQLVAEKAIQKLIEGEVKAKLEGFAIYERPRRVALLPRLLSEEEGELTPSLKVKTRVVIEKWADRVAHLFGDDEKE